MKIAIYGRTFDSDFSIYIQEFFEILRLKKIDYILYKPFYEYLQSALQGSISASSVFNNVKDAPKDIDFMVSIGGDGTFLESIMYIKDFNIPVIGLNSGRLGFLANISKNEISEAIDNIQNGNYQLENRSMLELDTQSDVFKEFNYGLNDVTIQKKDSSLITIDVFLNEEYLNTYWTDGLIVSTPTGSTAYNLSTGGPIIVPGSNNFVIVPIASHNLTVRPIVIPDDKEIKLRVKSRSGKYLLTVDNRTVETDLHEKFFYIRRASFNLKMVKLPFNSYYSTLRNKLMWGADKRN